MFVSYSYPRFDCKINGIYRSLICLFFIFLPIWTYSYLVMMTFQVRLKTRKPNQPRLRFDLEKLRDPDVACTFQATIGGKFAPLIGLRDEDMDMDTMITTYNTAVTDAASEILGKERRRKKTWVTKDVLDLCDERRDLKKKRYEAEGAKEYRETNRRIQKAVKKAKED